MNLENNKEYRMIYNNFRKGSPYNVSCYSDAYTKVDCFIDKYKSKEDIDIPNKKLLNCPICFEFIWEKPINCQYCKQFTCQKCYDSMLARSYENNKNLNCPFCRITINNIFQEINNDNFVDVENPRYNQIQQNEEEDNDLEIFYLCMLIFFGICSIIFIALSY